MEHKIEQRTPEWFELRKKVSLTASQFGDALGLGKGRSYDYLVSLVSDDEVYLRDDKDPHLRHGTEMEQTIHEVYQLLTGAQTKLTGFWTMNDSPAYTGIKDYFGASPDALILGKNYDSSHPVFDNENLLGLAEFKAPVYQMYSSAETFQGIPRQYMAQIQGQMFLTGAPWCDFLAVCIKTRELRLKRVYFHELYWQKICAVLKQFCNILKEAKQRKKISPYAIFDFKAAKNLKFVPQRKSFFTGEDKIRVVDLLQRSKKPGMICGPSNIDYTFSMLVGEQYDLPQDMTDFANNLLQEVDLNIKSISSDSALQTISGQS